MKFDHNNIYLWKNNKSPVRLPYVGFVYVDGMLICGITADGFYFQDIKCFNSVNSKQDILQNNPNYTQLTRQEFLETLLYHTK